MSFSAFDTQLAYIMYIFATYLRVMHIPPHGSLGFFFLVNASAGFDSFFFWVFGYVDRLGWGGRYRMEWNGLRYEHREIDN